MALTDAERKAAAEWCDEDRPCEECASISCPYHPYHDDLDF